MIKAPINMKPGDDTHLTLLMAPVSLNFVTGQDREHLLAYGRAAFEAGQKCQGCSVQQGTHVPMGTIVHPDDMAVDALAAAMKAKLAKQRAKGYGGWDTDCTQERLSELLRGHVDKGDPVDVANFCAFLLVRGEGIAAVQQGVQPPFMYAIADGYGQPFFEEQGCVSSEAKDLQPEVDSLNQNLDGEPPYKVVALYTHPTQQGLAEDSQDAERFRKFAAAMLRQDSVFEEAIDAYPEPDFDNLTIDDVRAVVDAGIAAVEAAQAKQGGTV